MKKNPVSVGVSDIDFTKNAKQFLDDLIKNDGDLFFDNSQSIYDFLTEQIERHDFSDYLKRHLFRAANLSGDYREVPVREYQSIIINSFRDNGADFSFYPSTVSWKTITENWLKSKSVHRDVVLLLGFGLKMPLEKVNEFFSNALREPSINPKDPLEAVCQYCFQNGFTYPRFRKLWDSFDPDHPVVPFFGERLDNTVEFRKKLETITDDASMLAYLCSLPLFDGSRRQSPTVRKQFDLLYDAVCEGIAEKQKDNVSDRLDALILAMKRKSEGKSAGGGSAALKSSAGKDDSPEKIGDSDIENLLYTTELKNDQHNLLPMKESSLYELFNGKRINRQHIGRIRSGEDPISRFDLITMSFLKHDLALGNRASEYSVHYEPFIDDTNQILKECNMGPLYPANPYECFILLCMRTESPIETYAEIWRMSYGKQ